MKYILPFTLGILAVISLSIDADIVRHFDAIRTPAGNVFMMWITSFTTVLVFFAVLVGAFFASQKTRKYIFPLLASAGLALVIGTILKMLLLTARPEFTALTYETSPGFPSLHTAIVFSAIPILAAYARPLHLPWIFFAIIIAVSRMYVGVHFLSDVLGGAAVGLITGYAGIWLESRHDFSVRMMKAHIELRRQVAHLTIGMAFALLIHAEIITLLEMLVILFAGTVLIVAYKTYPRSLPPVTRIFSLFERKLDRKVFPGKGPFFLVLGTTLTMILFPREIVVPAIIILAIGDSVNSIAGRYFGSIANPFNPQKSVEGSVIGCIAAASAASMFAGFWPALFASIAASFAESLHIQVGKFHLNDNIVMPLIAGLTLSIWYS